MKIGFAQINPTVGDLRGNCELIIGAYERLAAAGAELVLTPELSLTGYPPQDLVFKSRFLCWKNCILSWENPHCWSDSWIAMRSGANPFITLPLYSNVANRFA
jgi:hypothetical protein